MVATAAHGSALPAIAAPDGGVVLAGSWWPPPAEGRLFLAPALACFVFLSGVSSARAWRLRALRRRSAPSSSGRVLDFREIAFLVDGPRRLTEVLLVAMHRRGRAAIAADRRISLIAGRPEDEHEQMVFQAVGPARTALVDAVLTSAVLPGPTAWWRQTRDALVADGLILSEDEMRVRGGGGMCGVFLLGLGLAITGAVVTPTHGASVGLLSAVALAPLLLIRPGGPQTDAGRARIAWYKTMSASVYTDTDEDVLTRVAVFGVEAIPDEVVRAALMPLPTPPSSSS